MYASSTKSSRSRLQKSLGIMISSRALYSEWQHPIPYHLKPPISTIGKRFQDAGLLDLCVGSGVISEGSITKCDGRAQIQSCWQASQDPVRCDIEASRFGYMSTCRRPH